jgi:hypothetical protein
MRPGKSQGEFRLVAVFMLRRFPIHSSRRSATGSGTGGWRLAEAQEDLVIIADHGWR